MFKVIIYTTDEKIFLSRQAQLIDLGLESNQVIHANSDQTTRLEVINSNLNQWLFFMDHDCYLDRVTIKKIKDFVLKKNDFYNIVVAGLYKNPDQAKAMQQAHNFIANHWVMSSFEANDSKNRYIVGGSFLIKANNKIHVDELDNFWGAEDKYLSIVLKNSDFKFYLEKDILVTHATNPRFWHFIKRSYLHGKNDILYLKQKKNNTNYLYWLKNIDFSNLNLVFLVLLHFLTLQLARNIQKIRQMSK